MNEKDLAKRMLSLENLGKALDPVLEEGETYYAIQIPKGTTTSGGMLFRIVEGKRVYDGIDDGAIRKMMKSLPHGQRMNAITLSFPDYTKVRYTFQKGKAALAEASTPEMLLQDMLNELKAELSETHTKTEILIDFLNQPDEVGMDVLCSTWINDALSSKDSFYAGNADLKYLYYALEGKIEKFYCSIEKDKIVAQSFPAYSTIGLSELQIETIELEAEFKRRREASLEAIRMRHSFYKSLGQMHEEIIYLNVGPSRERTWPGYSTKKHSAFLRVIYTKDSSILITDGFSNVYNNKKQDAKMIYNGMGAEIYVEFEGIIPFETLKNHYIIPVINNFTQIALNYGDLVGYMKNKDYDTIQTYKNNIETYAVVIGNYNTKEYDSYFNESDCPEGRIGILVGMKSEHVPEKMKLNLEEVLLFNMKPFSENWIESPHLFSANDAERNEAIEQLIHYLKEKDNGHFIPISYRK